MFILVYMVLNFPSEISAIYITTTIYVYNGDFSLYHFHITEKKITAIRSHYHDPLKHRIHITTSFLLHELHSAQCRRVALYSIGARQSGVNVPPIGPSDDRATETIQVAYHTSKKTQ